MNAIDDRPVSDRPAERLDFLGAEPLNDDEVISVLLGRSPAAMEKARTLLNRAGGMTGLRRMGLSEMVPHLGLGGARRVKAALEVGRRALLPEPLDRLVFRAASDVAAVLQAELCVGEQEAIHVFGLDARHRIRHRHVAAIGQVDRVQVAIADVYRPLVREGLAAVLVAHNHPSGEPSPSPQDQTLTLRLAEVGQLMGIPLLDHVVVGRGGYYSFAENGLLDAPRLAASGRWRAKPQPATNSTLNEEHP